MIRDNMYDKEGYCKYCGHTERFCDCNKIINKAKKEVLNDLDKLFTKHIREEKKKPQTDYILAIIRALSFARREVKKRHLSTFQKRKET